MNRDLSTDAPSEKPATIDSFASGHGARRGRWFLGACACAGILLAIAAGIAIRRSRVAAIRARLPRPPAPEEFSSEAMPRRIAIAEAAAREKPTPDNVGMLAMVYHANVFPKRAATCYDLAAELAPDQWRWHYGSGLVAYESGQVDEAVRRLRAAVDAAPSNPWPHIRLGQALLDAGRLSEADREFAAAASHPQCGFVARFGRARVAARRGDWAAVVRILEADVRINVRAGSGVRLYAAALEHLGRGQEARGVLPPWRNLPSGIPLDDPFVRELENLSCSSTFLLKQAVEALRWNHEHRAGELLYRALAAAPNDVDVRIALADYCRAGALTALNRGRSDMARTILKECLRHARKAVDLAPGHPQAWLQTGAALLLLGRPEEAVQALQKALQLDPALSDARRRLALALAEIGRFDEACSQCREALQRDPSNTAVLDTLGVILARHGDWAGALDAWRQSARINPDSPVPLYNAVRALLHLGRPAEAKHAFKAFAARFPDFPGLDSLQKEIGAIPKAGTARTHPRGAPPVVSKGDGGGAKSGSGGSEQRDEREPK